MRGIAVELLPDEDEGDGEEVVESKPRKRGLFGRAKAAMAGNRVNHAAKFARALAALTKIEQRRQHLLGLDRVESQVASELLSEYQASIPSYNKAGTLDEARLSYRSWLVAEIEATPKIKFLRDHIGGLMRMSSINPGGDIAALKSEFPELKTILADAICAKAAQLRADADCIAESEQARLDKEYGKGEHDSEDSTPVKRARTHVSIAEDLVKRVQFESVESVYLSLARYLLP